MKRILIVVEDKVFTEITKVKEKNNHTWEQTLLAYADAYKRREKKDGKNNNFKKQAGN
jgi:hypothetical protein